MMVRCSGDGKVNVRLLITMTVIIVMGGMVLALARHFSRGILSEKALAAGQAAFEKQDWPAAVQCFRQYLGHNPRDLDVLRKYAEALIAIQPPDRSTVAGAIATCRRILQLDPGDQTICDKLATLYTAVSNYEELAAVARIRIKQDPNDVKAPLWLGEALIRLNKNAEARQVLESFIGRLETLPGNHTEYVRACVLMSGLTTGDSTTKPQVATEAEIPSPEQVAVEEQQLPTSLDWLNRAVTYAPDSTEALAYRARFNRLRANVPDANDTTKRASLTLARRDLEAADALGTDDPRLRYSLGVEWMLLGELDRATAELQVADKLSRDNLKKQSFDLSGWTVARFMLGSDLALRKGAAAEAAALAD